MAMTPEKKRQRKERQEMIGRLVDRQIIQQSEAAVDVLGKLPALVPQKAVRRMDKDQLAALEKKLKERLLETRTVHLSKRQMLANAKMIVGQVLKQSQNQAVQDREIEQQGEELALQQISRELPSLPTDTALDG